MTAIASITFLCPSRQEQPHILPPQNSDFFGKSFNHARELSVPKN